MVIKAMNVGEILDGAFSLFRQQYKTYLGIIAISIAVSLVVGLIVIGLFFLAGPRAWRIGIDLAALPAIAVFLIQAGGLVHIASEQIQGRKISAREGWRFGMGKVWRLFFATLFYMIVVMIGFVLLVIPGIYLMVSLALYNQTAVIEDRGPSDALTRSGALVKDFRWRCLGIFILVFALVFILSGILEFPLRLAVGWIFGRGVLGAGLAELVGWFATYLFAPFSMLVYTLLYYDLRVRKENLDLQLMVDNLTGQSGPGLAGK